MLTEDEKLKLQLNHTLNLPGGGESVKTSDAYAAAELEQAETPAELEARFLAERGISARPSVFPYQDGKVSKRSRELEKVLAEDQERKDRYGDDYRIHKKIEGW